MTNDGLTLPASKFLQAMAAVDRGFLKTPSALAAQNVIVGMFDAAEAGGGTAIRFLLGPTRSGKSHLLLELLKQKRFKEFKVGTGMIRPILYAETPQDANLKALSTQILKRQGSPNPSRGTVYEKMPKIIHHLKEQRTRVLIIDEAHMLSRADAYDAAEWLKSLLNQAEIQIVIAGLPDLGSLRTANAQLEFRSMSTINLTAIDWQAKEGEKEFIQLMSSYQGLLRKFGVETVGFVLTDEAIARRVYALSLGLIGIVSKFLREALLLAHMDEDDALRLCHLRQVAQSFSKDPKFNVFGTPPLSASDRENETVFSLSKSDEPSELLPAAADLGSDTGNKRRRRSRSSMQAALPSPDKL